MPAQVELVEDGHVLHYIFTDPWTINDMAAVNQKARKIYDAATHKVHVVLDVSGIRGAPPGFLRAYNNPDITHPNAGYIAVVGAGTFIRILGDTILKVARFDRARFFEKVEPAWEFIHQMLAEENATSGTGG